MIIVKKPYEFRGTSANHICSKCGSCISLYINTNDNTEVFFCNKCENAGHIDANKNKWKGTPLDFHYKKEEKEELIFFHRKLIH